MKNLHDVQTITQKSIVIDYGVKRKWDIELMGIELDNLYHAGVVSKKEYMNAKLILSQEHEIEEEKETSTKDSNGLL